MPSRPAIFLPFSSNLNFPKKVSKSVLRRASLTFESFYHENMWQRVRNTTLWTANGSTTLCDALHPKVTLYPLLWTIFLEWQKAPYPKPLWRKGPCWSWYGCPGKQLPSWFLCSEGTHWSTSLSASPSPGPLPNLNSLGSMPRASANASGRIFPKTIGQQSYWCVPSSKAARHLAFFPYIPYPEST